MFQPHLQQNSACLPDTLVTSSTKLNLPAKCCSHINKTQPACKILKPHQQNSICLQNTETTSTKLSLPARCSSTSTKGMEAVGIQQSCMNWTSRA